MIKFIKKNKNEIIVVSVFLFFALGFNIYRVQSDGLLYYRFLEYILHLPDPESFPNGFFNPGFHQSVCAYFNLPFYLIAYFIEKLLNLHINFNGITLQQIAINLASNFYMILSLLLILKILRYFNFKNKILPTIAILFSTSAFATAVIQPSLSHAVDIYLIVSIIYLISVDKNSSPQKSFWLGVIYVLLILSRYMNFVLIFPMVFYYFKNREFTKIKYIIIGILSIVWIVPLIFYVYNGSIFAPRSSDSAVEIVRSLPLIPKYFFKYLVHPLHGLFIWSPVTIFSLFGLLAMPKTKQKLGYLFLGMWFSLVVMYGFIHGWHAGWSFSNRYLVGFFPIYIIGLSAFLEKYRKKAIYLVLVATLYSVILYLNWHLCIMNGEFGTPADMVKAWTKGESNSFLDTKVNLQTFANRLYEMCRYKYLFKLIK